MTEATPLLQLHDIDLLLTEVGDPQSRQRFKKLGFDVQDDQILMRARARTLEMVDRRWINLYERALKRYGRGLAVVRDRVCQGCHITLPTSAAPSSDEALTLCESCGRILYWR